MLCLCVLPCSRPCISFCFWKTGAPSRSCFRPPVSCLELPYMCAVQATEPWGWAVAGKPDVVSTCVLRALRLLPRGNYVKVQECGVGCPCFCGFVFAVRQHLCHLWESTSEQSDLVTQVIHGCDQATTGPGIHSGNERGLREAERPREPGGQA